MDTDHHDKVQRRHGYFQTHFLMERAHEWLTVGLASILRQAKDDHSKDMKNWLGYVGAWVGFVVEHHHIEETILFPFFQSHGFQVETELEQHKKIHDGIDKIQRLIQSTSTYDAAQLERLLRAWS
ncbi:hypothetical protein BZG36_02874 [Bifiguratus adelaidae]|uniref:Hemerythrin-like domain-containing protein n=1 Tax=Bifiguratus adelaidae TaxID=1938954 RepID=A0A261Y203_9FUNG|nr:hypothetical protein BZG36_02874 [Bifiguratus adelaidae]